MQLCALEVDGTLVFAEKAHKRRDYSCLECRQPVRLRKGLHRQAHFFHSVPNGACRLHAKGLPHLMLQYFLQNLLPDGEAEMECRFPAIGRIADIAWHAQRLIYEIQCSPISAAEVAARNAAYASVGYRVVWILHDSRYNQRRLAEAEDFLRDSPHYYTDINQRGEGQVYDQFSLVTKGMRTQRLPRVPIDLSQPDFEAADRMVSRFRHLPLPFRQRAGAWQMRFSGDVVDRCLRRMANAAGGGDLGDEALDAELAEAMRRCFPASGLLSVRPLWNRAKVVWQWYVAAPYRAVLRLCLERACR